MSPSGDLSLTIDADLSLGPTPDAVSGADPFKIVEIDKYGQPQLVLDLEDYNGLTGSFSKERDTFRLEPAAATSRDVDLAGRRGGSKSVGIDYPNSTLGATFTVRGTDADTALAAAEKIAKNIDDVLLRPRRYFKWTPRGATKASYFQPRGPGAPGPLTYRSIVFQQLHRVGVQLAWPVAPYALDLPMRWVDPLNTTAMSADWNQWGGAAPNTALGPIVPAAGDSAFVNLRHYYGASERLVMRIGRATTPPAANQWVGIHARWQSTQTYLALRVRTNNTPQLELFAFNPFGTTAGPTTAITFAAGDGWVGLRLDGNIATAEWWTPGHTPEFHGPDASMTWDLAAAGINNTYGVPAPVGGIPQDPVKGRLGIYFQSMPATGADRPSVKEVRVTPVFRPALTMPATVEVPNVPGDLEPLVDVELTSAGLAPAAWAGIGWNSKLHNPTGDNYVAAFGKLDSSLFDASPSFVTSGSVLRHAIGAAAVDAAGGTVSAWAACRFGELDPDDFMAGQIALEVFALLTVPATVRQLRAALLVDSTGGSRQRSSLEWGTAGRSIPTPAATRILLYKLGTVIVDPENDQQGHLRVNFGYAVGSTGNLDVDYLWATPASRSARKRDGIALDASYPRLQASAGESVRIAADLTSRLRSSSDVDRAFPHTGLGGAPIEPDAPRRGGLDLAIHAGEQVPDNPDTTAGAENPAHTQTIRVNIWPRYRIAAHG